MKFYIIEGRIDNAYSLSAQWVAGVYSSFDVAERHKETLDMAASLLRHAGVKALDNVKFVVMEKEETVFKS